MFDVDSAKLEASKRKPFTKQIVAKHKSFQKGLEKFKQQQMKNMVKRYI